MLLLAASPKWAHTLQSLPHFLEYEGYMENQLYGHLIFYLLGVNYRRISTGDCSLFSVKSLPVSFISVCSIAVFLYVGYLFF